MKTISTLKLIILALLFSTFFCKGYNFFDSEHKTFYRCKIKQDGKHGKELLYYENGQVKAEINWYHGKKNGVEKIYLENGILVNEINWKTGKKNGIEKSYYSNAKIKKEMNWVDGRLKGRIKSYNEAGKLESKLKVVPF